MKSLHIFRRASLPLRKQYSILYSPIYRSTISFSNNPEERNSDWFYNNLKLVTAIGSIPIAMGVVFIAYEQLEKFRGQLNDEKARQALQTCVIDRFLEPDNVTFAGKSIIERNPQCIPSMKTIHRYLNPDLSEGAGRCGVYILSGPRCIGKTTLVQMVYNNIKQQQPHAPIIFVQFEEGLDEFASAINAYPQETRWYSPMPEETLSHSCSRMINQLKSNAKTPLRKQSNMYEKDMVPVLVLDDIKVIPESVFPTFAGQLKSLIDKKLLKVIFIASDGKSIEMVKRNRDLFTRLRSSHRIENHFDIADIAQYINSYSKNAINIENKQDYEFLKLVEQITGGRIGYVDFVVNGLVFARGEVISSLDEEDISNYFFDCVFCSKIQEALQSLLNDGIPYTIIDQLITADLPVILRHSEYRRRIVDTLEKYKIIYVKGSEYDFECEPLRYIFSNPHIRDTIKEYILPKKVLQ